MLPSMGPTDGGKVGSQTADYVIIDFVVSRAGGVMIWAGISARGGKVLGLIRAPETAKFNSDVNCQLLKSSLLPLLDDVPFQSTVS